MVFLKKKSEKGLKRTFNHKKDLQGSINKFPSKCTPPLKRQIVNIPSIFFLLFPHTHREDTSVKATFKLIGIKQCCHSSWDIFTNNTHHVMLLPYTQTISNNNDNDDDYERRIFSRDITIH